MMLKKGRLQVKKGKAGKTLVNLSFALALPLLAPSLACGGAQISQETISKQEEVESVQLHLPKRCAKTIEEAQRLASILREEDPDLFFDEAAIPPERVKRLQVRITKGNKLIRGWMDEGYLGPDLSGGFHHISPIMLIMPALRFDGKYFGDTNIIGVNPSLIYRSMAICNLFNKASAFFQQISKNQEQEPCIPLQVQEQDLLELLVHEQHHYAAYLGGGVNLFFVSPDEKLEPLDSMSLHEGLTELFAQELTRKHGYEPAEVGYTFATATAFYIQRLLESELGPGGIDLLKSAYFFGDFMKVRAVVDSLLGVGTFRRLVFADMGNMFVQNPEGLCFMTNKMASKGIDYSRWARGDKIMHLIKQHAIDAGQLDCEPF